MEIINEEEFRRCVRLRRARNGNYIYECRKGLWSVEAFSSPKARREAYWYFVQYKSDGEYSDIIGGPTVLDVIKEL